jgi:glycosyltransferase involved in cell wall biosynthesis
MSVTIIIPFVEDRGYLKEAIESAENQTYKCEILLSQSENNVGYNLNKAIAQCSTEFWVYLCDDDILPKDSIEKRLQAMKGFDFMHSNGMTFRKSLTRIIKPQITDISFSRLLKKNHIFGGTCMYRTEWRDRVQWDESLWTGEEFDYHLNLLLNGAQLGYLDEVTYHYRVHNAQKSSRKNTDNFIRRIRAIKDIRRKYDNGQPSND